MSEITKLYENANIEKEVIKGCYEYYSENGGIDIYTVNDCKNKDCNTCKADKSIKEYPPFTADKQIELFKWLIQKYKDISIEHKLNLFYINIRDTYTGMVHIELNETIAGLINNLWQDLTEDERKQIREILE